MPAFTAYDPSSTPATALTDALVGAAAGITVDPASIQVVSAPGSVNLYDGSLTGLGIGSGILITSGTTPPESNTSTSFGVDNGMPGDPQLDAIVNTVFATQTYDASSVTFDFTVTDPSVTSISFNLAFGSDEFPEWASQFVDIGAVIVDGQNAAVFGPNAPLTVTNENVAAGYFVDNQAGQLPIEYDGMSKVLTATAAVHLGVNTVKIAVADCGDHVLDSGLFISGLHASNLPTTGLQIEVAGTSGDDDLTGTSANEKFDAGAGNDSVDAGAGNDTLLGQDGNDTLSGGDGDDLMDGGAGSNTLNGGAGDDLLISKGNDVISGGDGTDELKLDETGSKVGQTLDFSAATQTLANGDAISGIEQVDFKGGAGADHITGGALNDVIFGGAGADVLFGGAGDDTIAGGPGNDTLDGGAGIDTVSYADATAGVKVDLNLTTAQKTGGGGTDLLTNFENVTGSAYNDTLTGTNGDNVIDGGAGTDTVSYAKAAGGVSVDLSQTGPQATGGAGTDTLLNIENVTGSKYADTLMGDGGNNVLNGGGGVDTVSYANAAAGVTVDLSLTAAQDTGGAGVDTLKSLENLTGSTFDDVLKGSLAANVIDGGAGNDTIVGGGGKDTLFGGDGADHFVFNAITDSPNSSARDTIMDFSTAQGDVIDLSHIDAVSGVAGSSFTFTEEGFSHTAGELYAFQKSAGVWMVQGDVNGDGVADFSLLVHTTAALSQTDFLL
jgi:Ca2+-binding RTX toxin-like protein